MNLKEKLSNLGGLVLGIGFALLFVFILAGIFKGVNWLAITIIPYLYTGVSYAIGISILLLPLAFFNRLRIISVVALGISAALSALFTWCISFLAVYSYWGLIGAAIGFAMGGIGVIPLAFIAAIFHGDWSATGDFAFNLGWTFGLLTLTAWIASKLDGAANG